jgi:septal ring factor EnvC (AmiA/AmiB activator)
VKDSQDEVSPINEENPDTSMRKAKHWIHPFLLAFLIWFAIFVGKAETSAEPAQPDSETSELTRIERELRQKRESLERLDLEEKQTFEEVLDLEESLDLSGWLIGRLMQRQKSVARELEDKRRNLRTIDSTVCDYRRGADIRLREIYEHGRTADKAAALAVFSPVDLGRIIRFTGRILKIDGEFLSAACAQRSNLTQGSEHLNAQRPRLSRQHERVDEERLYRLKQLQEKERLLRKIESERGLCLEAIRDLEEEAFAWGLIPGWDDQRTGDAAGIDPGSEGKFELQRGRLPWPVQGSVVSTFGLQTDRTFHTTTQNSGIEITTEGDAQVLAVADGTVAYVSRLRGYGNLLLVAHGGDYFTLYARLSVVSVSAGETVRRLQNVGRVEADGSNGSPALHFEIRKGRRCLDPLEWLR